MLFRSVPHTQGNTDSGNGSCSPLPTFPSSQVSSSQLSSSQLQIKDFDYRLPDEAVAKYPLPDRDQSKLLVWENGVIKDQHFSNLPGLLPEGSMLIFNNTRVIKARLHFTKSTGARIEVFCLEPTHPHDYVLSFASTRSCRWKCMVGNLKRWRDGKLENWKIGKLGNEELEPSPEHFEGGNEKKRDFVLRAELVGELEGGVEIEFSWDHPEFTFSEILEAAGNIPIPPYLHRESMEIDETVYQTVYSKIKGSVAAPTAGLHFTENVFKELAERNISCEELTLHVGAGTFQPVKSDTIGEHRMHTEHFSVSKGMIERIMAHKGDGSGKIFAVGTTSVRTLESLYWLGRKIIDNPAIQISELGVKQWEPYNDECTDCKSVQANLPASTDLQSVLANEYRLSAGTDLQSVPDKQSVPGKQPGKQSREALQAILNYLEERKMDHLEASTRIIILPGYRFRIIDGVVTNFHQPQSTLLLLISAILGRDWIKVYEHALKNEYRFLSYGDANLYFCPADPGQPDKI